MTPNEKHEEQELNADLSRLRALYERLPREAFSRDVEASIMDAARKRPVSRQKSFAERWRAFISRPKIAAVAAMAAIVIVVVMTTQRPAVIALRGGPAIGTDVGPRIEVVLDKLQQEKSVQVVSDDANQAISELIGIAGSIEKLVDHLDQLEKEGKSTEAKILRDLLEAHKDRAANN